MNRKNERKRVQVCKTSLTLEKYLHFKLGYSSNKRPMRKKRKSEMFTQFVRTVVGGG